MIKNGNLRASRLEKQRVQHNTNPTRATTTKIMQDFWIFSFFVFTFCLAWQKYLKKWRYLLLKDTNECKQVHIKPTLNIMNKFFVRRKIVLITMFCNVIIEFSRIIVRISAVDQHTKWLAIKIKISLEKLVWDENRSRFWCPLRIVSQPYLKDSIHLWTSLMSQLHLLLSTAHHTYSTHHHS